MRGGQYDPGDQTPPAGDRQVHQYIERCYENNQLTNNGPLAQELKARLEEYLGVQNLLLVANGTLALQIAYKVLGVSGKAITTPFTFVATSSSLRWEGIEPVYADIDAQSLDLSPEKVLEVIDPEVTALVPVHVYGNPCDVEAFDRIAKEHGLKVIYDAAHAFGVRLNGKSILQWGDAATLSFHATKVFHTVEGGAIIFKKREDYERACRLINFGYEGGEVVDEGINAKMSEFHAAMGLCMLDEIDTVLQQAGGGLLPLLRGIKRPLRDAGVERGCHAELCLLPCALSFGRCVA
jgi:dTDP-4-amino-4,6-dideoxygalactose transaminase